MFSVKIRVSLFNNLSRAELAVSVADITRSLDSQTSVRLMILVFFDVFRFSQADAEDLGVPQGRFVQSDVPHGLFRFANLLLHVFFPLE